MMTHIEYHNFIKIRLFTALFSALLSFLAFYTDDIINRDGILYMDMAQAFLQGGLSETAQLYNWPFFSILVAYFHSISTLSFELSANIINTVLFVVLTDALVLISHKTLNNTSQLVIAAVFILCFQSLNEYRDFIIRDIGYWAFCSLALYHFMQYVEAPSFKKAIHWQACILVSILFRIEGMVILLGLPLYLFFNTPLRLAIKTYLQANYLFAIATLIVISIVVNQTGFAPAFSKLSSITYYVDLSALTTSFHAKTAILSSQILNQFSEDYAGLILVGGLLSMFIYKLLKGVSLINLAIYIVGRTTQKVQHASRHTSLLIYFSALNIVILLTFLSLQYFISTRYMVMTFISLLLLILPTIAQYIERAWIDKQRTILIIVGLALSITLIDSLTQIRSKAYIKETALWAADNLPNHARLMTNEEFLRYYFSRGEPRATIKEGKLKQYSNFDYIIVTEEHDDKALAKRLDSLNIEPIYSQQNKRGDKVSVYRVIKSQ